MKKNVIIFELLLSMAFGNVCGQVVTQTRILTSLHGSKEMLRIYGSENKTLMYQNSSDEQTHRFVYVYSSMLASSFVLPTITNLYGNAKYTVNDMRIIGKRCFFCGKLAMPIGHEYEEPQLPPRELLYQDYVGFIAMVDLDSIEYFPSANMKVQYSLIDKTSDIRKLAILASASDTMIGMIGIANNVGKPSCLVTMRGGGNTWSNNVYAFPDCSEILTDIAIGDKSLITASLFEGEPWTFGVRYVNISALFDNDDISEYRLGKRFDTENMYLDPSTYRLTWHSNDVTIRLVAMPYGNDVTVAYKGKEFTAQDSSEFNDRIALFYINGSSPNNITMDDAKTVEVRGDASDTFLGMEYIPPIQAIGLLHIRNNTVANPSCLAFFKWNSTNYTEMTTGQYPWSSFDVANGCVWTAGWSVINNRIVHEFRNTLYSAFGVGCLYDSSFPAGQLRNYPSPDLKNTYIDLFHSTELMEWEHKARISAAGLLVHLECVGGD